MKKIQLIQGGEPISPEELEKFVNEFELKLPNLYKSFILASNGGYPNLSAFGNPYEDGSEVDSFYAITMVDNDKVDDLVISSRDVIKTHQILEKNLSSHFYPFADDIGGAKFCFSMNDLDFGSVYLIFLDGTTDEPTFICDSFEEFINGLEDIEIYEED
ncbi:SMI1 / KNR4 family (SUKH-1) [Tenacibaculum sp. MAR_2009_124]|uniref:SMI1/KNR4 family protein n=1 Tax=Tenacibaculum sp. MAR_2009_124 TaxID=1250059 RepID=UPI00089537FA|nr:SMI1/KNR4 family protein [Tenacibaculum sp. MAR_2009_124]SEC37539.1 SMI1 / KNR4 family (SUKH-1) [Tenacibaculum sp. MAR_2009_124]